MAPAAEVVLRQRLCRASSCGAVFWICRHRDRGQQYCSDPCREKALKDFDIFVAKHFPDAITVTRPMVAGYLETQRNVKLRTQHGKLTVLRQFCRFLFQLNPNSYIPGSGLLPALRGDFERGVLNELQVPIFVNSRKEALSRFGIRHILQARVKMASKACPSLAGKRITPHTWRHTTAMHLLQSGVGLSVIKTWLGHVNLETTHAYVEIDLEMKRKALSSCAPLGNAHELRHIIERNKDDIQWLESL